MCPAAGISPLRVGPEDVTASEAGELVEKVGVGNQAKDLIAGVARLMPKELRTAAARYEHKERSKMLVASEVATQVEKTVGDAAVKILSARVRGSKSNPLDSNVVVLFALENGRTTRCAIGYGTETFPKSISAFNKALADGTLSLTPDADPEALRGQVERLQAEVERLTKEAAEGESGATETPDEEPPPAEDDLADYSVAELRSLAKEEGLEGLSKAKKDDLLAAIREHRAE